MSGLWWTKWHWDRFFSELSVFSFQFHSTDAPLLVKLGKKTAHLHHRVAQKALRLWCVRIICCGALHHVKKKGVKFGWWNLENIFSGMILKVYENSLSLFNTARQLDFVYYLIIIQFVQTGRFGGFPPYFFMWKSDEQLHTFYFPESGDRTFPRKSCSCKIVFKSHNKEILMGKRY
jgi:hypothetical protein